MFKYILLKYCKYTEIKNHWGEICGSKQRRIHFDLVSVLETEHFANFNQICRFFKWTRYTGNQKSKRRLTKTRFHLENVFVQVHNLLELMKNQ